MDPDGSIYFYYIVISVLSCIFCLYTAIRTRLDEDGDYVLGVSPGQVSGFLLWFFCAIALCLWVLPKLGLWVQIGMGAIFILLFTVLPFCIGLAQWEKLGIISKIASPFARVMEYTLTPLVTFPAKLIFKIRGIKAEDEVTPQDVMDLVEDAHEDVIDEDQKEMIENIFELDDMTCGDIMTHRTDVLAFDERTSCAEIIEAATQSGFSRLPVYRGTIDSITGILYVKDLIALIGHEEKLAEPVSGYIHKPMFVPEACAARELLVQFKKNRNQIAVVVDEYGGTSGIVTMEDILEEIVGNIQDEYDNEEEMYRKNRDGSYTCLAAMELDDLLELFGIPLPEEEEEEDFDSVGGLIIDRLGRIPATGENAQVEYKGLLITVLEVADRRIVKVRAEKLPRQE